MLLIKWSAGTIISHTCLNIESNGLEPPNGWKEVHDCGFHLFRSVEKNKYLTAFRKEPRNAALSQAHFQELTSIN